METGSIEKHFGYLIGESKPMEKVYETLEKLLPSDLNVVIRGETGTGKELVARVLHEKGPRSDGPFRAVNCGRLSDSLLESELFGHVEGAFTGAKQNREGVFEQADGGTLFLDEVESMPDAMQKKLLRVLETSNVRRVGGDRERSVNVRVLSATSRSLKKSVAEDQFRRDLYYRLKEARVELPPLEKRRSDIPLLARYFLQKAVQQNDLPKKTIDPDAMEKLKNRNWPGNVRELENTIQQMALFGREKSVLSLEDKQDTTIVCPAKDSEDGEETEETLSEWHTLLPTQKRKRIREALEKAGGNKSKAAELLGISRRTIYRYLDENP